MMMLLNLSNLPHHCEGGRRNCVHKIPAQEGFKLQVHVISKTAGITGQVTDEITLQGHLAGQDEA